MTTRRDLLAAMAAVAALPDAAIAAATPATGERFSWPGLKALATRLAARPFAPPPPPPASVDRVDYDAVGAVRYKPSETQLADAGGVRFFPVTRYQPQPVAIAIVTGGVARPFPYSPGLFDVPAGNPLAALAAQAGFSGFRAMEPSGTSDWLAFAGASYFRTSGALDQYGLSARGIAIDSGGPMTEEFPAFTRFWLEKGVDGALVVHALLEGPSVAGAYRFVNRKGPHGVEQDVEASLTLRRDVARLGLAPLTSMFWYDAADRAHATDWRPAVHDSDGLLMLNGRGERIWRPLGNPPHAIVNSFADQGPKGFGLMQRDRAFDHYQDDGVFYEKRPSAWVEPVGDWGVGAVTLVELPTGHETDDNIVAFWTPAGPARAGRRFAFSYRLRWIAGEPLPPAMARVVAVRRGAGGKPGLPPVTGATKIVVDFQGASLSGLDRASGVAADLQVTRGGAAGAVAYPVSGRPGMWRFMADIRPAGHEPIDVRLTLRKDGRALTETCITQMFPA